VTVNEHVGIAVIDELLPNKPGHPCEYSPSTRQLLRRRGRVQGAEIGSAALALVQSSRSKRREQ
jgi:hypothetical protein